MGLKYIESKNYQGVRYAKLANGDTSYYVRFTKNGKQIQKKVGTKFGRWSEKLAFNKKIELESNYKKEKLVKFQEAIDRFLEIKKLHLRKESFRSYETRANHLKCFNDKNINEITQKDMNDLILNLSQSMANKTINQIVTIAKQIMRFAEDEFQVSNQNLNKIRNLKVDNARERFLSKEEIATLKKSLKDKPEHLLFVNLALCTGARLMSILNIKKKDIDIKNQTIVLRDFKNGSTYQGYSDNQTQQMLLQKWERLKDNDNVIEKHKKSIVEPLRDTLHKLFNQNNPDNKQKVVIHSLRHTFASHLAIGGVSIQIIQKLLNHKDIKMTMRYSHLMPQSGKEAVQNLWEATYPCP